MKFKASFDTTTKIISLIATLLVVVIFTFIWMSLKDAGVIRILLMIFVTFLALVMPYGLSITRYGIDNEALSVCRPFGKKQFPLATVTSASIIDPKLLRWSWRVFGSGGMFGYYGRFSNKHFGMMTWYLTSRNKVVYLQLENGKKIMISPDDPEGFLREYHLLKGIQ
ncbi:PH domain-containing protein [Niabella soli]|uniref:Bacterial Pleckstrin homology domain-containing protein n=1 Tax=Niabella soli DSM 19437 TaxID=929713 RepID=W0F954_9BACT|nr:PH domain-containing protein [Niabella soli]AHF18004.1 hypothetical protein NIASO_18560 [Niabella soli DSM 19437]